MNSNAHVIGWTSLALLLGLGLAACGDTWEGLKQDTADNVGAVGGTMEDAGEEIEEETE